VTARLAAVAAVGLAVFVALGLAVAVDRPLVAGDAAAVRLAAELRARPAEELVARLTDLGSLPATALLVALSAIGAARAGRRATAATLVAGLALTWLLVHLAKAAEGRPRPPDPFTRAFGLSYPSGHAAYAVAFVACALAFRGAAGGRAGDDPAARGRRRALVAAAVLLALLVGASRVYLRVHYLSDVVGGFGLAAASFALAALAVAAVGRLRHNGRHP